MSNRQERYDWVQANRTHEQVINDLLDREDASAASAASRSSKEKFTKWIPWIGAILGAFVGWIVAGMVAEPLVDLIRGELSDSAVDLASTLLVLSIMILGGFAGYQIGTRIGETNES